MPKAPSNRWFPTTNQLDSHEKLMSAFRQMLEQHYALVDDFGKYKQKYPPASTQQASKGSGPADTMLCGLFVAPVDVQTLGDGAILSFNSKNGNFQFGGQTKGVGNAAAGGVTAPGIGTGSGPANSQSVVSFLQISVSGTKYWVPVMQ